MVLLNGVLWDRDLMGRHINRTPPILSLLCVSFNAVLIPDSSHTDVQMHF